jgi:SAM-dependent methyltransferase
MAHSFNEEEILVHRENIKYYDKIANSYNPHLEKDDSNTLIRQKVKDKFINKVKSGCVLDFGGGTGLDLEWLTAKGYKILFCEPSVAMREHAINYNNTVLHNGDIIFLAGEKTDFTKWQNETFFSQRVDAVLSNFGAINNIKDIKLLFKNLSFAIKPGGHLIAVLLDHSFKKMLRWHRKNALRALIFGTPFRMYVWHEGFKQTVFVHSTKEIKKACFPFFDLCETEFLGGFGFRLVHLVRQ